MLHTVRKFPGVPRLVESLAWISVAPSQKSFGSWMVSNSNIPHHCCTTELYFYQTDRAGFIPLMQPPASAYGELSSVATAPVHPRMVMAKSTSALFMGIFISWMPTTMVSGFHESVSSLLIQSLMLRYRALQRLLTGVFILVQLKNSIVLGNTNR